MSGPLACSESPLLSVVIPTRERCTYLTDCVRSVLACTSPDIEIVVSDNASTDGTKAAIDAFADARLVYVNPGVRLAMHDNFEFALSKSRGRYLMFIGDDDAVLPDRVNHLLNLLREERPEVVNWYVPDYVWPGGANGADGVLTLKPSYLRGGRSNRNARELLCRLAEGSRTSYRLGGAKIYHGCVARHVVDQVVARAGRYFFVPWPDVGAAIANLFVAGNILVLGQPCTLGGESRASSGWSLRFQEKQRSEPANPFAEFMDENLKRSQTATVDARIRTISALTFLTLAETIRRMAAASDPRVNDRAWMPILESELASLPEPVRSDQADIVDSGLQAIGLPRLDRAWLHKQRHKRARIRPPMRLSRLLPNRMSIVSRPGLYDNVYEAALLTDRILGRAPEVRPRGRLALAAAWLGALARAGKVIIGGPVASKVTTPLHQEADGRA